jgi:hypothetical protein
MSGFLARITEAAGLAIGLLGHLAERLALGSSMLTQAEGAFVAVLGLVAAVIGGRGAAVRLVGAAAGGLFATLYVARITPWLEFLHIPVAKILWAAPVTFGAFGALLPEGIAFFLAGLTLAAIASALVSPENHTLVVIPSFLIGGTLSTLFFSSVALLASSFGGGLAFAAGVCAALPRAGVGGWMLRHPVALVIFGLVIGWVGFVGQMLGPTPEEKRAIAAERAAEKKKSREAQREASPKPRRRKAV